MKEECVDAYDDAFDQQTSDVMGMPVLEAGVPYELRGIPLQSEY